MTWEWWFLFAIALVSLWMALVNRAAIGSMRQRIDEIATVSEDFVPEAARVPTGGVAVVYNPAKVDDVDTLIDILTQASRDAGYGEPAWFETSVEDPGISQTRAALALEPSVVVAVGGDGTVRVVAGELAGTDVALGIIPAGTGNLLARNLNIPITSSLRNLASIAVTGRNRRIDVGRLSAIEPSAATRREIEALGPDASPFVGDVPFLVIAGMGFDADVMNDADGPLKETMGWGAYVVSGAKFLRRGRFEATLTTPDVNAVNGSEASPPTQSTTAPSSDISVAGKLRARSILFGNCARLPAGFVLAPDARIDDGWLDIMIVDTKGGLLGWIDLIRRVSLQSIGVRKQVLPQVGSLTMRRMQCVDVHLSAPELVEADGDALGYAIDVRASVQRGALLVHVL